MEISLEELQKQIGKVLIDKNTEYIFKFLSINKLKYTEEIIDLKIIKNKDNSFSIYENHFGELINSIRKTEKKKHIIIPIGIMKTLSNNILKNYEDSKNRTIYSTLFFQMESEEKLDIYLFYTCILLINSYDFNIEKSSIEIIKDKNIILNGIKKEFIISNTQIDLIYDSVGYKIELFSNINEFIIIKQYKYPVENIDFYLNLEELIQNQLYEFESIKK